MLAEGHAVVAVDNLATGSPANLAHLTREPRLRFVEQDITQPFDPGPVDLVLNFASPASPRDYHRLGIETLLVGSAGTKNMLEIARRYNARFVQASTSECYGDPAVHPQEESYWGNVNPVGPRSVYDESKRFAEAIVTAYHRYHGVRTRIVRIFNTYGPRLQPSDGRVISTFLTQALQGEPLTVYGDGSQTRSFCYVSDLVEGIVRLAASEETTPVNLGNPDEWTILECAHLVRELVPGAGPIIFEDLPQDDPTRRRPEIAKARQLLGWQPTVSLRAGLERTLPYFTERVLGQSALIGASA